MKTFVVGNQKGGSGKTITTVNLGYSFSLLKQKVLLIDLDPQNNTTPFFSKANQNGKTVWDVMNEPEKVKRCIYHSRYPGIDIIKGDTGLCESDVKDMNWLCKVLQRLDTTYDVCVIDTRPVFENITTSALRAADVLLTPACLDKFCRDNLNLVDSYVMKFQEEHELEWKVFATKVDTQRKAQKSTYEDLLSKHEYPFMETCISRSAVVDNALDFYKPVMKHRSKSEVAQDYMDLARELLSKEG